jgi:hypothetical protein
MSPISFDRLKSLPLTIILTVLIWMYAEAKFTATGDARLTLRPVSPSGDLVVRVFDPGENRYQPTINIAVTLQGPTNQIGTVQQESDTPTLTFVPPAAGLNVGTENRIDTVTMLNENSYFRKHGLRVAAATPSRLRLEVDQLEQVTKTVDFHPPIAVEHMIASPDQVTVLVPSKVLQEIGGAEKLTVTAEAGRELATLRVGAAQTIPVRYVVEYPGPHDDRVTVDPPQGTVTISLREAITWAVPNVPVWVSGPPVLLSRYDVDVQPKFVRVAVSGAEGAVRALQDRISAAAHSGGAGAGIDEGIHAYLDISPDERPTDALITRRVRYVLPDGLTAQDAPAEVRFRLIEKSETGPTPR